MHYALCSEDRDPGRELEERDKNETHLIIAICNIANQMHEKVKSN